MRRLVGWVVLVGGILAVFAYLQSGTPKFVERRIYPLHYGSIIRSHSEHYRLEPALLAAVVYQESRFKPDARSSSGAIGLMQLLPDTAKGIAIHTGGSGFVVADLYDPELNIRYGSWYLRHLLDKYGDERTALAAYNAGQRNVDRWRAEHGGIEFAETRAYVTSVEKLKAIYRRDYASELGA
jgi:soluble lytic murein transglycosylase